MHGNEFMGRTSHTKAGKHNNKHGENHFPQADPNNILHFKDIYPFTQISTGKLLTNVLLIGRRSGGERIETIISKIRPEQIARMLTFAKRLLAVHDLPQEYP